MKNHKRLPVLTLAIGLLIACMMPALCADIPSDWRDAREILFRFFQRALPKPGNGLELQAPASGERFFITIGMGEPHLINYNEIIVLPGGQSLFIRGKHSSLQVVPVGGPSQLQFAICVSDDLRSFGKQLARQQSVLTIDKANNAISSLSKADSERLIQQYKPFTR